MQAIVVDRPLIYTRLHSNPYFKPNNYNHYSHGFAYFHSPPIFPKNPRLLLHNRQQQPRVSTFSNFPNLLNRKDRNFKDFRPRADNSDSPAENTDTPATPPPSPPPRREKRGGGGGKWKWKWQPLIQAQEIGVLLLQLGVVMFVMRLLRPGIPLPGSEPRPQTTFVSVPYSEFLHKITNDEVQKVEVDGVHILFKLKKSDEVESTSSDKGGGLSDSETASSSIRSVGVAPTAKRVVYSTTRPADIKAPYEKMLDNRVEFGSPDKRSGGFLNSALVMLGLSCVG